jgi:hypothetical protein
MNRLAVSSLFLAASLAPAAAQVAPARSEVPVSTVVLFSSGVGYFEHAGMVHGNGTTELRFRTAQMNDVLKSLVLQDMDGGRVTTITYPSQDPISKTLRSFQVDITGNPSLAELLNQLRGARVTVASQAERISGTILGVETRSRANDKEAAIQVAVLNLLTGATIKSVELPQISSLTFDDPQLQDELTKALTTLSLSRDQDKKPVLINFAGGGDRRVRIGYVVEAPIWKSSYRLLLGDKGAMMQGWAIVENQTESDWNNVSLSLVSGRPISFTMDLYTPLYQTRQNVQLDRFSGVQPQVYDGGTAADSAMAAPGAAAPLGMPRSAGGVARAPSRRIGVDANGNALQTRLDEVVVTGLDAAASVRAAAEATRLGELFQYTVPNVTLPRQKSALIPIVTDAIDAEAVSIYNAAVLEGNPLNGARLKNTTGKNLLQGPITVLDRGNYAGDATIQDFPAGQERLLSYGIDLDVLVRVKGSETSSISTAKIAKGLMTIQRKMVSTESYVVDNKADKAKTLIIERPLKPGTWTFSSDSPKPYETTASLNRFRIALPAKKTTTVPVNEEWIRSEAVALVGTDVSVLLQYSRMGEIPQAVRDAIAKAAQLNQNALDAERQASLRSQQIAEMTAEQARIRENMKTVTQSSEYYQRLLAKLNEQESAIEKLQRERADFLQKRDAARRELQDYLGNLNVG